MDEDVPFKLVDVEKKPHRLNKKPQPLDTQQIGSGPFIISKVNPSKYVLHHFTCGSVKYRHPDDKRYVVVDLYQAKYMAKKDHVPLYPCLTCRCEEKKKKDETKFIKKAHKNKSYKHEPNVEVVSESKVKEIHDINENFEKAEKLEREAQREG